MPATERHGRPHASTACDHCGLPVPEALRDEAALHQFCCSGCRLVFRMIHAQGLSAYYSLRDELPEPPTADVKRQFEEFDDPAFRERSCRLRPDGLVATELYVEGVHCSACLWLIERSLDRCSGVAEARLNFVRRRLRVVFHPEQIPLSSVVRRLVSLGYTPHPTHEGSHVAQRREDRALVIRLGIAGAVAGNVMLMAVALYGGWWSGMAEEHRQLFRYMSLIVSLPAVLYAAWPFYRSAWTGLRAGVLHMDLPISLGIGAGFMGGLVNTIRGDGEVYFDSVTTLIFLLLVGRLLQLRQQRRASESSELLYALTPSAADRLERDGQTRRVPLTALGAGDRVVVPALSRMPTDGVVERGTSSVDLSLLSGESVPIAVRPRDEVWGGTTNLENDLVVRVTKPVTESRVGRIANLIADAGRSRAPIVRLADTVAGYFVGVVLLLSLLTFTGWTLAGSPHALDHAVALLIVSCPCALGLATPLAITAAIGKAARNGILVRSGAALEALGRMRQGDLFFDKTGTLTHGRLDVVCFEGPDWVRPLVVAAEAESRHPVGRALRAALDDGQTPRPASVDDVAAAGLEARVDGQRIVVGSPFFVRARALYEESIERRTTEWTQDGLTPVWVAVDGRVVATAGLADQLRPEAAESIRQLADLGFDVRILSGDHPGVVDTVGRRLGLPRERRLGGVSPEQKLEQVRAPEGDVVMVGDGMNDAAALAAATVGIAVHGGAETCLMAADVFLQKPGVATLVDVVRGARQTHQTIRVNIAFSLVYNLIGASLAVAGALNPLLAAVLMPASSLIVVANSFRSPFPPHRVPRATAEG